MRSWGAGARVASFGLLLAAAIGCGGSGKSPAPDACAAGSERCACYGNGTCNTGLLCLSHLCVRETGNDAAVDRASGAGGAGTGGVPGTGGTSNGNGGAGSGGSAGAGGIGAGGTAAGGIGGTAAGGTSGSGGKGGSSQGGTAGGGKGGAGGLGSGAGGGGKGGAVGGAGSGGTGTGGAAGAGGTAGTGIAGAGGTATGGAGGAPTGGAGSGGMDAGGAGGDPGCAIVQCPASVPNCCKDWFAFVYDQATGLSRPDLVTSFSDTSTEVFATFNFENTNQIGAVGFDLTQEIDINYLSVVEGTSPSMIVLPSLSFETPTGDGSCLYAIYNNDGTYFETTSPEFYPCSNFTPGRASKINFRVEPQYFTVQPGMGFGGVSVSSVGMIPF